LWLIAGKIAPPTTLSKVAEREPRCEVSSTLVLIRISR
jgi:hypothetical protein